MVSHCFFSEEKHRNTLNLQLNESNLTLIVKYFILGCLFLTCVVLGAKKYFSRHMV